MEQQNHTMTQAERQMMLEQEEKRSTYKRFCDDIIQRLDDVKSYMADRAIWELFQNAGDVAQIENDELKAHIRMTLTPERFIFAHKGKPFTFDTLNSLVKQVSSRSKETDENATGQYGTGFVTTHSFGKVLTITGSMERPYDKGNYIDIDNFVIDRSYDIKQDFYDKLPAQLDKAKAIALSEKSTTEVREWTELSYDLSTAIGNNGLNKALRGIDAALKTLPYLMTINPTIAEVEIDNQVTGTHVAFKSQRLQDEAGLHVMAITITANGVTSVKKVYYIESGNHEDVIILPLSAPNHAEKLDGMAKLFVNYPLIGTEKFCSEFIFHSRRFIPVEERNGIYLPEQEANSPQKYENNVKVLNEMADMLFSTLSELQLDNWEEILSISLDEPISPDELLLDFYRTFKQKWVEAFKNLKVFNINGDYHALSHGGVALYSKVIVDCLGVDDFKYEDAVYQAVSMNYTVPSKECLIKWSHVVATWCQQECSSFISNDDIAQKMSQNCDDTELLLEFDKYIAANDLNTLFDKYTLIPNREGVLMHKNQLRDAKTIKAWVCNLVSPFVHEEVAKFVDTRFANLCKFTEFTRKDLSNSLTGALTAIAKETLEKGVRCSDVTLNALANIALIAPSVSDKTIRYSAMKVVAEYLNIPFEIKVLEPLDSDEHDIAALPFKHLIKNLLLEISTKDAEWVDANKEYVRSLHQSLAKWAEYYNRNDKKGFAKDFACFPNMLMQPTLAAELRSAKDIPAELFGLYEAIVNVNLRDTLVDTDFAEFCEFTSVDASSIAKEIEEALAEKEDKHPAVLDIIGLMDEDPEKWCKLFARINSNKANIFMDQVKPECKEGIYQLMKINDADKLDQLVELVKDDFMDEILRAGQIAVLQRKNDKADFEYKHALGKHVEDEVLAALTSKLSSELGDKGVTVRVEDCQYGQDIIVFCNNYPVYYIEVKSRWSSNQSVEMSQLQMNTCVEESGHYALCCLNMSGTDHHDVAEHIYPPVEETINKIKAITNIGNLAKEAYNAAHQSEDTVHLGGGYKCIVPQKVIDDNGENFEKLIDSIIAECVRYMDSNATCEKVA